MGHGGRTSKRRLGDHKRALEQLKGLIDLGIMAQGKLGTVHFKCTAAEQKDGLGRYVGFEHMVGWLTVAEAVKMLEVMIEYFEADLKSNPRQS
jgi:hypothetical protein